MKQIYKTFETGFEKIDTFEDGAWINLINPTPQEINEVSAQFDIEINHILSALDEEERARIEVDDNCTVIIVDVPIKEAESGVGDYVTIPMTIILGDKFIITACLKNIKLLEDFSSGKVRGFFTYKKTRFILQLLYKNASYFLQYLRQIDRMSHKIEQELHKSMKNKELIQLLDLEKSLVYFTTSLRANEIVLEKMMRMETIKQYPEDKELLEDVIIENKQAIEMANIYSNILSGTMDAFASVISNNLNIVMKTLTSITIVMSIPTMIASFFGMNVPGIPLSGSPHAFLGIVIMSFILSAILAGYMIKKKLF
ncbi:MAG: magnesium transporter CorA family protein [Candidatus Cellulosilyticum pullistercoris]|uniref:Magnesium transporter CorA family protein n=1 Tax=Candidatus Cellulosilyticum pullistercoris TaxID=2838521 RepID=A0A9E2NKQ2_9FIRM|nr:magnesium transporter CorA family protein [Candidatus Cellulosilyticum pullistercoris]